MFPPRPVACEVLVSVIWISLLLRSWAVADIRFSKFHQSQAFEVLIIYYLLGRSGTPFYISQGGFIRMSNSKLELREREINMSGCSGKTTTYIFPDVDYLQLNYPGTTWNYFCSIYFEIGNRNEMKLTVSLFGSFHKWKSWLEKHSQKLPNGEWI